MNSIFRIDPNLDIPLYRQLVDRVQTAIKKGQLPSGEKLPTVQELSDQLSIARGTIKRAYDELERKGLLEKVQGRGTFVCYQPVNAESRKEKAMAAIDAMLNQLEEMGLSAAEIHIFLNLKLRQRAEQEANVKVVVVDSSPENLAQMLEQLRGIDGVDLYSYLLDSIRQYPYQLGEDLDLLVTTAEYAEYLQSLLPPKKRVAQVALRPAPECIMEILRLAPQTRLGILGFSAEFTDLVYHTCSRYIPEQCIYAPLLYTPEVDVPAYLQDKQAVVVPQNYDRFFPPEAVEYLRQFTGKLIFCHCEMDEGSMLYLQTRIKRLLDAKVI